jgi:hypothetical protein
MEKIKNETRLYRFINTELGLQGRPFALCDSCLKNFHIPSYCKLIKIEDCSNQPCSRCQ